MSLSAMTAQAQSAPINVTANVFQALTVTGVNPLAFGNVFPGVAKSVATSDAGAGRFDLAGQANANVNLSFTLPTNLTSGGNNLPIGSWTGYANTTATTSGGTAFIPAATNQAAVFSGTGNLYVFIGGTVTPAANQAAGAYTSTVTLTAAYF